TSSLLERLVILPPVADAVRGFLFHRRKILPRYFIRHSLQDSCNNASHLSGVLGQVIVAGLMGEIKASENEDNEASAINSQRRLPFGEGEEEGQSTTDRPRNNTPQKIEAIPFQEDQADRNEAETGVDKSSLQKLFRLDNDVYRLVDKRLGGNNSARDFVRRLACLFLYMAELDQAWS
ncbi:MAG TPA: hypothetical protein VFZ34_26830, partial [Blastocatellia bacterium]|nr:hypothetical protein [Blastocatellia bacterium]